MLLYIHKGSLHDHLDASLEYLHTGCNPGLIHRDVKSSNILITSKYEAKVADFGLSRLVGEEDATKVLTSVKGTAGYLDPEYYSSQLLSAKSDVYGFGVVLLELLTAHLPIDRTIPNETNPNICDWVRANLEQGNIDAIVDPTVRGSRHRQDALWKLADIALRSVEPQSVHRPTMNEIVQALHDAVALEDKATSNPNNTMMARPSSRHHHHHHHIPSGYSDYSTSSQQGPDSSSFPTAR